MPEPTDQSQNGIARRFGRMPSEWPAWAQYVFALGLVALSLLGRWLLGDVLETDRLRFLLTLGVLLPLVVLVQPGPFLAAALLGWLGIIYLFTPPVMSFAVWGQLEAAIVGLYALVIVLTAAAAWFSRRAMDLRDRASRELRQRDEQLRIAKAAARLGLHDFNISSGAIQWDERTRELWGVDPDEPITYELWRDGVHPEDRGLAEAAVQRAIDPAGEGRYLGRYRVINRKDGKTRWIEATGRTTFAGGKPVRLVGAVLDITEHKQTEEASRNRSEQFQTLLNAAPLGVYLVDADFRISRANPIAARTFEGVPGGAVGRDFEEVIRIVWPSPLADEIVHIFRHTMETGESYHAPEVEEVRADLGVTEYYDWRVDRITLPDGRYGVVAYYREISEQVKARQAIAESEARYRTLFESIDEGFAILQVVFDDADKPIDHRFIEINPSFEKQTGLENALGKTIRELVPGIEQFWLDIYGKVALSGDPIRFANHSESMGRWFDVYAFRIGGPQERKVAVLFNDITARKQAEEALAEAREELEKHAQNLERTVEERTERLRETVAELEHFSYTITHDMRAPLRAMQAFGQILRDDYRSRLDEQAVDYLRRIIESAVRMDNLITDSLNYAKAIQTELVLGPVEPGKLLRGMMESYPQFQAPRARIEIGEAFPAVLANRAGLTQCFSNLLDNAVKFVENGKVPHVQVWAEERVEFVRIWIEDNGIGIPPDQRERVFAMFQRMNKNFEGTGVGLGLVRKVVERMRGNVGVEPAPEGGSRFWVELRKAD